MTLIPFQSFVESAISSPIFLGDKPKGPTLGAREAVPEASPPLTRTKIGKVLRSCVN